MENARTTPPNTVSSISRMPGWIALGPTETLEEAAFLSGAALSNLDRVAASEDVPQALWRERLALGAAEACAGFAGRPERAAALRDVVHLSRPGDAPGPAGEIVVTWRQAVARKVSIPALGRALPGLTADQIGVHLDAGRGTPVARAAGVLQAVLADAPRAETAALILADAVLAQSLGWDPLLPLLAAGLTSRDLRKTGDDLRLACHRAVVTSARSAGQTAADLARRSGRLRGVAPKLRAKGADEAVALFLKHDALAPAALTGLMSDRAARRLCDRLVALGALRELTGRDSFRLYGV